MTLAGNWYTLAGNWYLTVLPPRYPHGHQGNQPEAFVRTTENQQALQAVWESRLLQALAETRAKGQAQQAGNLCRPLGGATFPKLRMKLRPNVKLCRPLGRATFSML